LNGGESKRLSWKREIRNDATPISRGFRGRKTHLQNDRIPPGQHLVPDFPVLSAGPTPHTPLSEWSFSLDKGGKVLKEWSWGEFNALPQTELKTDIHCVTTWSKLDTHWRGVTIDDLLKVAGIAEVPGDFAMAHCDGDYTTNVPVDDLVGGKGMVATHYEGEAAGAGAWRGGATARAASLFLEKCQMGARARIPRSQRARILGATRLPHPRRSWRGQRYAGD
jgi:DMSO/TMAO reductase YedYZ molybdopterin-dependent catalytic subunit